LVDSHALSMVDGEVDRGSFEFDEPTDEELARRTRLDCVGLIAFAHVALVRASIRL